MSQSQWPDLSHWMDDVLPRSEILYSWEAHESPDRGAAGVTFPGNRAAARLVNALANLSPGASGFVERVALDRTTRMPSYRHGPVVLTVHRDETTGAIAFWGGPSCPLAIRCDIPSE